MTKQKPHPFPHVNPEIDQQVEDYFGTKKAMAKTVYRNECKCGKPTNGNKVCAVCADMDCKRKRVKIAGENYYLIVGKDWVQATVPRENDRAKSEIRVIVETLCREITGLMSGGDI